MNLEEIAKDVAARPTQREREKVMLASLAAVAFHYAEAGAREALARTGTAYLAAVDALPNGGNRLHPERIACDVLEEEERNR